MSKLRFGVIGTSKKEDEKRIPIHLGHLPRLPEQIRGFGHVKQKSLAQYQQQCAQITD